MALHNMCDIHSHILFGVDDGPNQIDFSLQMVEKEWKDGVRTIVLTPHYRKGMFETDQIKIERHFKELKMEAEARFDVELYLGCEFHSNMDMIPMLLNNEKPTLAGTKNVLLEFSNQNNFSYMKERCESLLRSGYQPVVAHVERYAVLRKRENLEQLSDLGSILQINAQSVTGENGWLTARFCHKMIDADLVHIIASDAHDMKKRRPCMKECADVLIRKYGGRVARELLDYNPHGILEL